METVLARSKTILICPRYTVSFRIVHTKGTRVSIRAPDLVRSVVAGIGWTKTKKFFF